MRLLAVVLLCVPLAHADWPDSIKWHGKPWPIYYRGGAISSMLADCPAGCWGVTWCDKHYIELDSTQDPWEMRDTVLHEVAHVVTDCDNPKVSRHEHIKFTTPRLLRVLQDNPKLRQFLFP